MLYVFAAKAAKTYNYKKALRRLLPPKSYPIYFRRLCGENI
jgi:hypothetical protein